MITLVLHAWTPAVVVNRCSMAGNKSSTSSSPGWEREKELSWTSIRPQWHLPKRALISKRRKSWAGGGGFKCDFCSDVARLQVHYKNELKYIIQNHSHIQWNMING